MKRASSHRQRFQFLIEALKLYRSSQKKSIEMNEMFTHSVGQYGGCKFEEIAKDENIAVRAWNMGRQLAEKTKDLNYVRGLIASSNSHVVYSEIKNLIWLSTSGELDLGDDISKDELEKAATAYFAYPDGLSYFLLAVVSVACTFNVVLSLTSDPVVGPQVKEYLYAMRLTNVPPVAE